MTVIEDRIAMYNKSLDDARKYADYLKSYFKKYAPETVDQSGNVDLDKGTEYLKNLLELANEGKVKLNTEEKSVIQTYAQVGCELCRICYRWSGGFISSMDELPSPPICPTCRKIMN